MDNFKEKLNLEYRNHPRDNQNWLWPIEDIDTWEFLKAGKVWSLPQQIIDLSENRDLIIQAGGNAGIYPKQYAAAFKTVITFEPDYRNFFCLTHNVPEENVFKFQACLGNTSEPLSLTSLNEETNNGEHRVLGKGIIPQVTIDSLGLVPDVIHLDIEGFEAFALLGAEKTLKSCNPILIIETENHGAKYNWSDEQINNLLESWGYRILYDWRRDKVYKKC